MRKTIIVSLIFLGVGILMGAKIYNNKSTFENVFDEAETFYFLQEGIYSSKDIMEENTKKIKAKVVDYQNGKYYVYVGITKQDSLAKKIKSIYENENYQIYIKEMKLTNEEFSSNITQFDLLINSTNNKDEILTINEVVLANYEEIIKKQ